MANANHDQAQNEAQSSCWVAGTSNMDGARDWMAGPSTLPLYLSNIPSGSFFQFQHAAPPTKIMELRPWTSGVTLSVEVVGTEEFLSKGIVECLVGDETGMIIFTARNYQVALMKEGVTVTLRNAKVVMFKTSMRLAVDRSGRVDVSSPANFTVKTDSNLSLIEFIRVDVCGEEEKLVE